MSADKPRAFFEEGASVGVDPDGFRSVRFVDLAIRFAFGFGVSAVAGVVTLVFGHRAGGLFLAFPAILPASLTLIEQKEGRRQAEGNAVGAVIGAIALGMFAVTAFALYTHIPPAAVEGLAMATWISGSLLLYWIARRVLA